MTNETIQKNVLGMMDGSVFGENVSDYGKEHGRLDYRTMAEIVGDMILANNLIRNTYEVGYWDIENGTDYNEEEDYYEDIYQFYIITDSGAEWLEAHTDEIVYYNEELDLYVWGITHWGTSWDYVLSDVELIECETFEQLSKINYGF